MKLAPTASAIVALSLAVAGCAAVEEVEEVEVVEEVTEAVEVEAPRHPLTGFELGGETVSGPSIAIKIDNTDAGRPQVGISSADIVFEELVEGGVTRYLAIFHTDVPDEVGPVRSGRPQDAELVPPFGGVFVFSGVGNSNVREIIRGSGLQLVEHDTSGGTPDGDFFFRSDRKPAPLNLHIEAASLLENYQDLAAPVQQFLFKTAPEEASAFVDGVPAEEIRVVFSNRVQSNWEWDAATGTYLKVLLNGSPDLDANGTQISATNLLIFAPNYFDVEGLPSAKVGQSREDAIIATGGKLINGLFDTKELGAPIKLFYGAEQSVFLSPGKTFILLPPGVGSLASGVTPGSITYVSNGEEIARDF